jgi:quinol monooxygenase YgiN
MSQTTHVVFACQAGKGADLLATLGSDQGLVATRAFEGCESVEAYTDADNPDTIVLWEKFATRADHEAYLGWRVETGMIDFLGSILASDLQVTYLDNHPGV